jgi:cytochrome c-type biogenesis protein CcsB
MHKLLLLVSLLFSSLSHAGLCDQNLESLPVLHQGRVKPYLVMAQETLKLLTEKTQLQDLKATKVICLLTLESIAMPSEITLPLRVDHVDIVKMLGLKEKEITTYPKMLPQKELIRSEIMKIKESNSYKKALNRLWYQLDSYEKLTQGQLWEIVDSQDIGEKIIWTTPNKIFADMRADEMFDFLILGKSLYQKIENDTFLTELTFTKSHIFSLAMLLALIGIFVTVLIKSETIGFIFAWLTIIAEIIGMTFRVLISGRAPITNMYETVLFSGFGALLIALIIFIFKRDKIILLGGLGYNILCLFMMRFAHGMLDESISPLVPVLRDNFWLSTHVTTIMLSYAALALSWLLANITLGKQKWIGLTSQEYRYYEELIYTSIKVGIILLAAGIILGGVWADYSWGRFWGWDPKETWSLIVLLFYMAVLHGKSTSWINTHRFVVLSAAGFMTVMMAWFGVNYILATGLHSYGFSEGGALFLGSFFLLQIIYLLITGLKLKNKNAMSV